MKLLIQMAKPAIKALLIAFLLKQMGSKTYGDFKDRMQSLSPGEIIAAFEGWIFAQVEKF